MSATPISLRRSPRRALIVGAGASGLLHALAFRAARIAIGRIFDPDEGRAELLASLVGGTPTANFVEARADDAGFVAICSPPVVHVEQACDLARKGRLVFVEKPVAIAVGELAELRRLPNVVPIVQWRAGRAATELRRLLARDAFGPAPQIELEMRLCRDDAYFEGGRRGQARWGCGAMLSIGIHAVDLLLWAVGRPVIRSEGRHEATRFGVDVPTFTELTLAFAGGARADLRVTIERDGGSVVRLGVQGNGASAWLTNGEGDPTGIPLSFRGIDPNVAAGAGGTIGSPLLVPFLLEAIRAFDGGVRPLSIDDVAEAHAIAFGCEPAAEIRRT